MSDLPGPIVLNATVQYNLSLTDDLDLLDVFAEDVVTVSTVVEELRYGVEEDGLTIWIGRSVGSK
jgi:predicted nucleic acid-binding protein